MSLSIPPSFGVVRGQDLNGGSSDKLPTLPAVAKRNWGQQLWAWEPLPFRRREDEIKRVEHQRWTGRTVTPLTRGAAVSLPSRLHLDHRGSRGQWTGSAPIGFGAPRDGGCFTSSDVGAHTCIRCATSKAGSSHILF